MDLNQQLFNIHDLAILISGLFCLYFGVLTLTSDSKPSETRLLFLALLFSFPALSVYKIIVFSSVFPNFSMSKIVFLVIGESIYWIQAPLLFLYIKKLLVKQYSLKLNTFVHFAPALVFILVTTVTLILLSDAVRKTYIVDWQIFSTRLYFSLTIIQTSIALFYFVESAKHVFRYHSLLLGNFSNNKDTNVIWLESLIGCFSFLFVVRFLTITGAQLEMNEFANAIGLLTTYGELAIVLLIVYGIYRYFPLQSQLIEIELPAPTKSESHISEIERKIEQQKLYLNPNITLQDLAETLEIPARRLSGIINHNLHKNFYELMNTYRVNAAKEMLQDVDEHQSISEIYLACGFNNRGAFSTAFKKHVGKTASEYRRMVKT